MTTYGWEVFICHASEDKDEVARPLANQFAVKGIKAWIDEAEIRVGDSLRAKIDAGLAKSRFGVVILSPSFFRKTWTKSELDGLIAREIDNTKVVLPVWHKISFEQVREHSPILAGRMAAITSEGLNAVVDKLVGAIEEGGGRSSQPRPIYSGRLTKKATLAFPPGSFLLSNMFNRDFTPLVAEQVPSFETRENYWKSLVNRGAANSKCYVFKDAATYRNHMLARDISEAAAEQKPQKWLQPDQSLPIDFDLEVAKALIALGKQVPEAWRPFITELRFDEEKYDFSDLSGLRGLDKLEVLDLFDPQPHDLEPLSELRNLRSLYVGGSAIQDISPLKGLSKLEFLNLDGAEVEDISALKELFLLRRLSFFFAQSSRTSMI